MTVRGEWNGAPSGAEGFRGKRPQPDRAQRPADGLTSATAIGTGEREAMRRACCTSEAVPAPPGNATTSTEAETRGGVGHGPGNGQLEQLPIADRPGGPAMALPLGRQHQSDQPS